MKPYPATRPATSRIVSPARRAPPASHRPPNHLGLCITVAPFLWPPRWGRHLIQRAAACGHVANCPWRRRAPNGKLYDSPHPHPVIGLVGRATARRVAASRLPQTRPAEHGQARRRRTGTRVGMAICAVATPPWINLVSDLVCGRADGYAWAVLPIFSPGSLRRRRRSSAKLFPRCSHRVPIAVARVSLGRSAEWRRGCAPGRGHAHRGRVRAGCAPGRSGSRWRAMSPPACYRARRHDG